MMLSNEEFSENIKSCKIETKPQNVETITNTSTASSALPVHDTKYYRDLLKENTASLNQQSCNWEKYSEVVAEDIGKENEEMVLGDIRTTVGQAKLLIKERFTQFSGLIDKCEFGSSDKPVLCQDLEGFWEMINFQVVDVQEKFSKLEKRRSENWANNSEEKKTVKKKILKKKSVQPPDVSNADKRLEARKRLASAKAALKKKVPPSVTFDAGFFKVDSPVRSLTDKSRTPSTAERKRPATPSSDNFLHGRFLKRKMEVLGPDLKKSLNFDVTTMDNCTDQDADVPCQAPTSVKVTETRSISTETETNEFVVEKALMAISQQISLIQDSFREKETNEMHHRLCQR
uniref:Disks large-associated protein 5 n=1 Tax=Ciona savignyi TaxID=51511 RepID=H2ZNL1_CIOSA